MKINILQKGKSLLGNQNSAHKGCCTATGTINLTSRHRIIPRWTQGSASLPPPPPTVKKSTPQNSPWYFPGARGSAAGGRSPPAKLKAAHAVLCTSSSALPQAEQGTREVKATAAVAEWTGNSLWAKGLRLALCGKTEVTIIAASRKQPFS